MTEVNVIVPIYNQRDLAVQCIDSVLSAKVEASYTLTLVDDASSETGLSDALESYRGDPRVRVHRNSSNLGFTKSANIGLLSSGKAHSLLLNSDTIVYDHWIDVLLDALNSSDRVATINPITNQNGSHVSCYPLQHWSEDDDQKFDFKELSSIAFDTCKGLTCEVQNSVGFCMLINRSCIAEIGILDDVNFPRGYGEETDFCYRARYLGWKNLVAGGAFVTHLHGKSFGAEKGGLMAEMLPRFRGLHPSQETIGRNQRLSDPLHLLRNRLDLGRVKFQCGDRDRIIATEDASYTGSGRAAYLLLDAGVSGRATLTDPNLPRGFPNVPPYLLPQDVVRLMCDLGAAGIRRVDFLENSGLAAMCVKQAKYLLPSGSSCKTEGDGLIFEVGQVQAAPPA